MRSEATLLLVIVVVVAVAVFLFFGIELHRFAGHVLDGLQVPPQ